LLLLYQNPAREKCGAWHALNPAWRRENKSVIFGRSGINKRDLKINSRILNFVLNAHRALIWAIGAPLFILGSTSFALAQPLDVSVTVQVDQVTGVQQKSENFGVVANLLIEWTDARLKFDAEKRGRDFQLYTTEAFVQFVDEAGIMVPGFVIHNQQGKRFSQAPYIRVFADGRATYVERFTATLQAPDFDFVQYPFDSQKFSIHVDSTWPTSDFRFIAGKELSGLGNKLGEEAWLLKDSSTTVSEIVGIDGEPISRFTLSFIGERHIDYYVLRIFIPLTVILLVSWATFYLRDFGKRIDIGGANLLVLVAFNFTISDNLPQLGYLTFLDAILVVTFVLTGLVIVVNVAFRRLEFTGRDELARRIDNYTIWLYPLGLTMLVLICWYLYEWVPANR